MPRRYARLYVLLALAAPATCSIFQSHPTTPAASSSQGPVRRFTDSDQVSDVAASEAHVYVATYRGVLKFPAAGGAPARLTHTDGLPADEVLAVAVTDDDTVAWAATVQGVARSSAGGHWELAGDSHAQPDVGRPTALLALPGGAAILGGVQGIARFDGSRWFKLSDRYQVTALARDGERVLVATAQSGLLAMAPDFTALDEHGLNAGLPDTLVRDVVPAGEGKLWALTQGASGSQLAYFDGTRWFSYTSAGAHAEWMALVPSGAGAALVTPGALYQVALDRGDELTPTNAAPAGGQRHVALSPVAIEAPPPPAAQEPPSPPQHGRHRPGAPAAHPTEHPAAHSTEHPAEHPAEHPGAHPTEHPAPAAHAPAHPTAHGADAGAAPLRLPDAGPRESVDAGAVAPDAGALPDGGAVPEGHAGAAPAAPLPPIRVREIPSYGFPVDVPHGGPTIDAPTFGLVRAPAGRVSDDLQRVDATAHGVFVARMGLGVTKIAVRDGETPVDFRVHDLAMQHRPLSLATDTRSNVWLVSEDGGAVRYDGRVFTRVVLEDDPRVHPLMFWSRGRTGVAVARVGDANVVRGYTLDGTNWRRTFEGPVETYGTGTVDAKFLAADDRGRMWVGLRVTDNGHARELGVAVLDPDSPVAVQYNENVPEAGGERGARRVPNDLTAVDFDREGNAWFAGVDGATEITRDAVHRYQEAQGLRGDLVSDIGRAAGDLVYFATPEGLGAWDGHGFVFPVEGSSVMPRAVALSVDTSGSLWGAGARGVWKYDGRAFTQVGAAQGLPAEAFHDLAIDAQNRVWFVNDDGLLLLDQAYQADHGT